MALACAMAVLAFYANRIFMPLPIFAGDEGAHLLLGRYSQEVLGRTPFAPDLNNSLYLRLVGALHDLTAYDLPWLRFIGLSAYLTALGLVAVSAQGADAKTRWLLLLLAVAFPYYRFVVTALPEGLYVLGLAVICLVTAKLLPTRPALHGLLAGGLAAGLALIKPQGVAVASALIALVMIDAFLRRQAWRGLAWGALFAAGFFATGNGIQALSGQPIVHPALFFLGGFYRGALSATSVPGALDLALLSALGMVSGVLLLAGAPLAAGAAHGLRTLRRREPRQGLGGSEVVFLLLALSLAATLVMVAAYAAKVAVDPAETRRLWGRYFEFFVPLLWLASAPYWIQPVSRGVRWASLAAAILGLAGLLACFRAGVVLFPWDATALTAFFAPDAARAPTGFAIPFRTLAVGATLALIACLAMWRGHPVRPWLAYVAALGLLSTTLDRIWVGPMVAERDAAARELAAATVMIEARPGPVAIMALVNNEAHLGLLGLDGAGTVLPAGEPRSPADLAGYRHLVVMAPAAAPVGWRAIFSGRQVALLERSEPAPEFVR